jgi:mersacidin/lichenicidin family type 2 lantibiotic
MSILEIIQAWKDEEFRLSLSAEQQALLPDHPAGWIELADSDLEVVVGGAPPGVKITEQGSACPPPDEP